MRRAATISAAALVALAAWEIAVLVRAPAAAPAQDDWQAVREAVDGGFAAGDLVVFAPAWMDQVGRLHLGHHLSVDDVARLDAARYRRIWEISARGAAAPEATGRLSREETHGALRLRLFEREPARVVWDLRSRSELLEVDYQGRRCAVVRAPGRLDAGVVPLGSTLVVRAGLTDFRARRDNRAFARVDVLVDGAVAASASIGSESGWVALPEIATAAGSGRVVFTVERDPDRGGEPAILNVCIAAEARQ
jgi:hypothetical protein